MKRCAKSKINGLLVLKGFERFFASLIVCNQYGDVVEVRKKNLEINK
jgi:hypothetical protein